MEDDLKLQDFDQWVKIFILKHEGGNLSKGSKILGQPTNQAFVSFISIENKCAKNSEKCQKAPFLAYFIELTLSKGLLRAFLTPHRPKIMTVQINYHN